MQFKWNDFQGVQNQKPIVRRSLLVFKASHLLLGVMVIITTLTDRAEGQVVRTGLLRVRPIVVSRSSRDDFTMQFVDGQCEAMRHIYSQIGVDVQFSPVRLLNLECDTLLPIPEQREMIARAIRVSSRIAHAGFLILPLMRVIVGVPLLGSIDHEIGGKSRA